MSPESFSDNYDQRQPEVADNPEAVQPAEQLTLQHLLAVITDKSKDGIGQSGERVAYLHAPGEKAGAATVWQIPIGTYRDHPECIGRINRLQNVDNDGGQIGTDYYILKKPKGLDIEKFIKPYNAPKDFRKIKMSPQDKARFATEGLRMIAASLQSEITKGAVSEQETRSLLTLLDPLVPFKPTPGSYYSWTRSGFSAQ